ncbi:MAG: hypothetical protein NMK33_03645 [Candidatus Cardinium sp.]|nr:MAG: hypothetical protein NMK33_03645 [Candidatus Cardinium sp.]
MNDTLPPRYEQYKNKDYDQKAVIGTTENLFGDKKIRFRDENGLKQFINKLLNEGHKIAITTFCGFPHAIISMSRKIGII